MLSITSLWRTSNTFTESKFTFVTTSIFTPICLAWKISQFWTLTFFERTTEIANPPL